MKNLLLLFALSAALFSPNATAQVTCYGDESKDVDFWLEHFYYAKCTDYENGIDHAGGHIFPGDEDYIGPSAYGGIDFPGIYVSQDGTYTVRATYKIGWTDDAGALSDIKINGEWTEQLNLFPPDPEPGTTEFEAELYSDYDNLIQILSVKDWPAFLGIQILPLSGSGTKMSETNEIPFSIRILNGMLSIDNLTETNNYIQINSMDGRLIESVTTSSSSYSTPLTAGLYMVNVNGKVMKAIIK